MKKNLLSVLLVFSFMLCLMSAGALAAPFIPDKDFQPETFEDPGTLPDVLDRSMPVETETESIPVSDVIPENDIPLDGSDVVADTLTEEAEENLAPESEPVPEEELLQEEEALPVEDDLPVVPEETRRV